jgi:NADPH:quinone reductase-like Zn-dependent oxidoreductase
LLRDGVIKSDIAGTYAIDQISDAARHAASDARGGKVLLRFGPR